MPSETTGGAPLAWRRGDRVADYVLDEVIGSGGMGVVWRAHDEQGQVVALKLLHSSLASADILVQRFLREIALGSRIEHPGVVRTFGGGVIEPDSDAPVQPWLAMELIEGRTLREVLDDRGTLPEAEVRRIGADVADALAAVHAEGVVHRDVKPDNLLLTDDGRVLLMDLGVARARDEAVRLTRSGQFAGSVLYAAPEQFHGGSAAIDGRADLYALGITLYELSTGQVPWPGLDLLQVYAKKMRGSPPWPSRVQPTLGQAFDAIVRHLLVAPMERRATSAEEVARWLRDEAPVPGDDEGVTFVGTVDDIVDLPRPDDAFVGRLREMHHIDGLWTTGLVVTLTGVAGSGKTRLALEYGVRYRLRFPGGVVFADLSECHGREAVLAAVAAALGLPLQAGDAAPQVEAALRGRGGPLVIVDNAEQVVEDVAELIDAWAAGVPDTCFLVTSRVTLGIPDEQVFPVEALGLPDGDELDTVSRSDAVRLFVGRARAIAPSFSLTPDNAASVAALVRGLDGLPLAIELAAARVRMLSAGQILGRLEQRWKLLSSRGGGRPSRQATLRDAILWSWELLDADQKQALAQLSVFEGGFDVEAAEAVVELGDAWVLDVLDELASSSLLRRIGGDPVRFGMYAAIHQFAREQLDEGEAVRQRHAVYYAELAREQGREWLDKTRADALARLVTEQANLRAVTRHARGAEAGRAAWALGLIAERRGPVELGLSTLAEVVARRDVDGKDQIELLAALARLQGLASRLEEGLETWGRVETLATDDGDAVGAARALTSKAMLHMRAGRMDRAREIGGRGLDAFERLDHAAGQASAHRALGVIALHNGDVDEGRRRFLAALDKLDPESVRSRSATMNNLGLLEARAGRHDAAHAWLQQALTLDRENGDRVGEGKVLTNLGILAARQGDLELARQRFEEGLAAHREGGNAEAEGKCLNNLAQIYLQQGQLDLAWSLANSAVTLKATLGQPGAEAYGWVQLGEVDIARKRWEQARMELERAMALAEQAQEEMVMARARALLEQVP